MELQFECIAIEKADGTSAILGHAGFIKTVEDLYEAMVGSVPGVKFGIAFAEASGPCLVRSDGNDDGLRAQAERNILKIAAGHTFLILFTEAYPINVISNVRNVSEVAAIYCATSNPVQVIVANVGDGRSVIGIVDGLSSRAVETEDDKRSRLKLLRDLGYKRG
jgi:adenosine/AMP kinase